MHQDLPTWAAQSPTSFRRAPAEIRSIAMRLSFYPGWYARRMGESGIEEVWLWNSRWLCLARRRQ